MAAKFFFTGISRVKTIQFFDKIGISEFVGKKENVVLGARFIIHSNCRRMDNCFILTNMDFSEGYTLSIFLTLSMLVENLGGNSPTSM